MLIKCKAPAESASGKQGDELVYSSWRGQQTARSYAVPSNPQTENQTRIRASLTTLTQRWKTLTLDQREAWALYSRTYPIINRLGNPVEQTALSAYVQQNQVHQIQAGTSSFVDDAPTTGRPAGLSAMTTPTLIDVNTVSINIVHAYTTLAGLFLMMKAKRLVSPAINPSMRACPLISGVADDSIEALVATGSNIEYANTRQDIVLDDTWSFYAQVVNSDGQQSQPTYLKTTIGA